MKKNLPAFFNIYHSYLRASTGFLVAAIIKFKADINAIIARTNRLHEKNIFQCRGVFNTKSSINLPAANHAPTDPARTAKSLFPDHFKLKHKIKT